MAATTEETQIFEDDNFYQKAESYWSSIDATDNGVLGGFGWISDVDIKGSNKFLTTVFKTAGAPEKNRALDCGAGIGRITRELLLQHFKTVDLVEQNPAFLEEAKRRLQDEKNLGILYPCSLRTFVPEQTYDIIWCQWVLGHLTDEDLASFFKRCSAALRPNGLIIVKENISADDVIFDEQDSSMTRPLGTFLEIFRKVGLRVVRQAKQNNFPSHLFSVKIFALRPKEDEASVEDVT